VCYVDAAYRTCLCGARRTENSQSEEEGANCGREAAANGVHGGPARPPQARVQRQQVPDGGTSPDAGRRAATERVADQDLVPEQASQDEEGQRRAQSAGAAADGSRTLQPLVRRTSLITVIDC